MDVAKAKSKTNIVFAFLVMEIQSCKKVFETLDVVIWVKIFNTHREKNFADIGFYLLQGGMKKLQKLWVDYRFFFFASIAH